ncbi:MAG: diphthine synthase [Crenarchaeota archaeon]|nr:diphthine synthase [Thermoproteota archaeon]
MTLYIVGLGPSPAYLSLRAISVLSRASRIYVDSYTSIGFGDVLQLVRGLAGPGVVVAPVERRVLEEGAARIIEEARSSDVAVAVVGDPLTATTHNALRLEAMRKGVRVEVVPAVSGLQMVVAETGLSWYKFGRPVTLVRPEYGVKPYSVLDVVAENLGRGLHTLLLLDLRLDEGYMMTIPEALRLLREMASEKGAVIDAVYVGVARAGFPDSMCRASRSPGLLEEERWPPPPHSIVVASPRLHPVEEESLRRLCGFKD